MNSNFKITASIVLYNSDAKQIEQIVSKFSQFISIFLIDNSPTIALSYLANKSHVIYISNPINTGFGSAHNIAINKSINLGSKYHFILNPDVTFESEIIDHMVHVINEDSSIGMIMPQILNIDGTIQSLPKLLPSPFSIIFRKLKNPRFFFNDFINYYELRNIPKDIVYNTPIISGCFTLLNLSAITDVGMYDDKYFMYFEDWDLSRRVHQKYKTLYYPKISIVHGYESGANKSFKLFIIYIKSAIHYFNKWGWFFDKERKQINSSTLSQFE
jgi:GT2 family glycosyltransferase